MDQLEMQWSGVFTYSDTGVPEGVTGDYVTLVVVHGFAFHAGIFQRLNPAGLKKKVRVVLLNRRDYVGATPLTKDDMNLLDTVDGQHEYMTARARELYDFLTTLVKQENLPAKGGIVLSGWSFGTAFMTAFLVYARTFEEYSFNLASYIRQVDLYDPPYFVMGYEPPANSYNPFTHASHSPQERAKIFPSWVSGYYNHGDDCDKFEWRTPLPSPRPTLTIMSKDEIDSALCVAPTAPGGSDFTLMDAGIRHGLFKYLMDSALCPHPAKKDWAAIKLKYICCDHSVWEIPWGMRALRAQVDGIQESGKLSREVEILRLRGANHFAHWDEPARCLDALLFG